MSIKMKKIVLVIMAVSLVGCSEKQQYEQAVLEQLKKEKDVADYKIDLNEMTECVVKTSSINMPGLFLADPQRLVAYKNYAKMLSIKNSSDPKKTIEELRVEFGSPKALADANANYTESVVECMSGLITSTEVKK